MLEAEFLGAVQILVYVGGIMVLFLFVIILVNVREMEAKLRASRKWKTAVVLGVVLSCEFIIFVVRGADIFSAEAMNSSLVVGTQTHNTESVGRLLYLSLIHI